MKLPSPSKTTLIWSITVTIITIAGLVGITYLYLQNQQLQAQAQQHDQAIASELEETNLTLVQNQTLTSQAQQLQATIDQLQSQQPDHIKKLDQTYQSYQTLQDKLKRNQALGLTTQSITDKTTDWGKLLLDKQYDSLSQQLTQANNDLDKSYQDKQQEIASRPTPQPTTKPSNNNSGGSSNPTGYSQRAVTTASGTFNAKIIQLPLAQYQVRTVSATATNCADNCPAKTLAQYINDNQAYAGVNGTYFCPPDYGSCTGKKYSFDFALFNSTNGQWINPAARSWDSTGMITFSGTSAQGCRVSLGCNTAGVSAAISNFPPLLVFNGQVQSIANQSTAQTSRNYKTALGVNQQDIFLVATSGTSLNELAQVMKSLGATHALNLDGGGSQALYISGAYKSGPGRLLPNAVVLVRR